MARYSRFHMFTFGFLMTIAVERRRRDKINNWIVQLSKLIPDCQGDHTKQGQVNADSSFYTFSFRSPLIANFAVIKFPRISLNSVYIIGWIPHFSVRNIHAWLSLLAGLKFEFEAIAVMSSFWTTFISFIEYYNIYTLLLFAFDNGSILPDVPVLGP